jgi:hypothetical protein
MSRNAFSSHSRAPDRSTLRLLAALKRFTGQACTMVALSHRRKLKSSLIVAQKGSLSGKFTIGAGCPC